MYQAFDWVTTAAVRHPGRAGSAVRWAVLLVLGLAFIGAVGVGSLVGAIVLGMLTAVALMVVMRGVYLAALDRHVEETKP